MRKEQGPRHGETLDEAVVETHRRGVWRQSPAVFAVGDDVVVADQAEAGFQIDEISLKIPRALAAEERRDVRNRRRRERVIEDVGQVAGDDPPHG